LTKTLGSYRFKAGEGKVMEIKATQLQAQLEIFITELRKLTKGSLYQLLLFGSRARCEASRDSDYDLLMILKEVSPQSKEAVNDLSARMLLEYGVVISAFLLDEEGFTRRKFEPFILNALKEAQALV